MKVAIAFASVVIIWSTTPLAINWSSDGVSFIFGLTSRMFLGAIVCLIILWFRGNPLPLHKDARMIYVAAGTGIYGAMLCVYWSSQYISSGLIAVIFGLSPMVTAVLAHKWLGENSLTVGKVFAVILGIAGLIIIFVSNFSFGGEAYYGVIAMLAAVLIHSSSGIWVKLVDVKLSPLELTSGALLFVTPFFLITWFVLDGQIPTEITLKAFVGISYLGVIGSVIGFSLYYYILKNMAVSKVALTTLITPVLALLIGKQFNSEIVPITVWLGTFCIIMALVFHQWGDRALGLMYMRKA